MAKNNTLLETALTSLLGPATRLVVVGIGSVLRGDDAVGVVLLDKLASLLDEALEEKVHLVNGSTAVESVTGAIIKLKPSHVLFVDAADLAQSPGHMELIDKDAISGITFSTHMLPLKIVIDYLHLSFEGKVQIDVVGIQPRCLDFCPEITLSEEVNAAADRLAATIKSALTAAAYQ
jgi:hydrogenase 3 maturation protease